MDEEEAIEGVKSGAYYAAIVIPENFSDSLLSILSGDVKKPQLDYYINEKKNACTENHRYGCHDIAAADQRYFFVRGF